MININFAIDCKTKKNVCIPLVNESFLSLVDGNNMRKFLKPFNDNINNKTKG